VNKKRIAFDVKGTIEGPKKDLVLHIFEKLQEQGHECVVWSNLYSYAVDAIKDNNLKNTQAMSKKSKGDLLSNGEELFDLCIEDDRSQTYLGAKKIAFVDELTYGYVVKLLSE